jgi:hypothetical protein
MGENGNCSSDLRIIGRGKKTFQSLQKVLKSEEEQWRLKSISLWLQDGDRNTKFFHRQAKARIWRNKVSEITNENGEEFMILIRLRKLPLGILKNYIRKTIMLTLTHLRAC